MPDVIVVAANARGEIVRYFEAGETAAYFGSSAAAATTSRAITTPCGKAA